MPNVLVYAASENGRLSGGAREALALGTSLTGTTGGGTVEAVLIGPAAEAAAEAIACGASRVLAVRNPLLAEYQVDLYLGALSAAARQSDATVFLLPFDLAGKDLVGRLAYRLGASALTEVVGFEAGGGHVRWIRPVYGGKALGEYTTTRTRSVIGVRLKSQEPAIADPARTGEVVDVTFQVSEADAVTRLVEKIQEAISGKRLEDARIIVGGGRGLGGPKPFMEMQELADLLGGSLGGSRAVCDAGWLPADRQIGQTGAIVAPDLYIAVGISGASQHLAGIAGAKTVVAINKDPDAHIFKRANIGIVADFRNVLPVLTSELRKILA